MLTVVVSLKAKPGHEDALKELLGKLLAEVRNEAGSGGVFWGRQMDGEGFTLIERYLDQAAIEAHRSAPHMATLAPLLFQHLDGAPISHIFEEI